METKNTTNQTTTTKTATLTKEEKQQRSAMYAAKRLETAKQRFERTTDTTEKIGLANNTLHKVHAARANAANVDGIIDSVLNLIKEVAKAANVDKQIIGCLKKEAANVINANINEENLCIYIDDRGLYKNESVYRLICSKSHNEELKKILNNLKKEADKKEGAK